MEHETDIVEDQASKDQKNVPEVPNQPVFNAVDGETDGEDVVSEPELCSQV